MSGNSCWEVPKRFSFAEVKAALKRGYILAKKESDEK